MTKAGLYEKSLSDTTLTLNMKTGMSTASPSGLEQGRVFQKLLSTNHTPSPKKSTENLMSTSKENDSFGHTVEHLESSSTQEICKPKRSASQHDHLVKRQSNFGQGLSNFLQSAQVKLANRVNQVTTQKDYDLEQQQHREVSASVEASPSETPNASNSHSSSSKKRSDDGVPLIKSSHEKSNVTHFPALPNPGCSPADITGISEKVKESDELKTNNPKYNFPSAIETDTLVSGFITRDVNTMKKFVAFNPEDRKHSPKKPLYPASNISFVSSSYPYTSQITQTGVPPIALALPLTGNLNINKVPQVGIMNPCFETSSTVDS